MKRRIFASAVLFALLLTASCGKPVQPPAQSQPTDQSQPAAASSEEGKITFTDALGQEFSIDPPQRTVVMIGSFADVWVLAGGEDTLAATANDAWESYGLDLGANVVSIGSAMKPSGELVLGAEPDLVIASNLSPSNLELQETFDRAGIPAAYFDVSSFQDYLDLLALFTQLTGHPENYETYGAAVKEQVDGAVERRAVYSFAPSVLTIQVSGSSVKVKNSEDNVLGPMLKELGCVNIADQDGSLLEELSLEAILQADPDYIFAVYHGTDEEAAQANLEETLLSNPAWASLSAVQGDRFYILERRMYSLKPNALWGDAYEKLADILCGE
ncbi:ABC transporter substrate-binding protein [Pseudoflavonifractor sp. 60]|uniref:ABC transporter substrate-binding protein n=1 Tax=Pseudoflavonifractor sp. 60 TaxID=2304576 RepID=UPI001371816B|nr:ABC transporter substrate-binding protein [Pseudoflavonifractor sp. 60]NBI68795.1 ABC transporter substrate-binding protein [Pseudoflavonifractor sp. 60]